MFGNSSIIDCNVRIISREKLLLLLSLRTDFEEKESDQKCYSLLTLSIMICLLLQNSDDWPVVDPLPSYGRGRELPGGRHKSLIYGQNLTDVVITGW